MLARSSAEGPLPLTRKVRRPPSPAAATIGCLVFAVPLWGLVMALVSLALTEAGVPEDNTFGALVVGGSACGVTMLTVLCIAMMARSSRNAEAQAAWLMSQRP